MNSIKRQSGLSLFEVILVLTIASGIIVLSLMMYNSQQKQSQFTQLQYNVNSMLQGLSEYYRANCYGTYDITGQTFTAAVLNPSVTTPSAPLSRNLYTQLQANGYININNLVNGIPLLDNSGDTPSVQYSAYVLQFNPQTYTTETINGCTSATNCTTATPNSAITNTNVLLWTMQVGVKVYVPAGLSSADKLTLMTAYQNETGADCTSVLSGGVVTPCVSATPSATNNYLVFARVPSFASANTTSTLWQTMPTMKQFNMQYSHDQMYELTNGSLGGSGSQYYYLCGG